MRQSCKKSLIRWNSQTRPSQRTQRHGERDKETMKPQKQALKHNPPDVYGDCFRTALASIMNLDRDKVPHFNNGKPCDDYWQIVSKWLSSHDLVLFSIPFSGELPDILCTMKNINPGLYYLLAGKSPRGYGHQVVALDDAIVCDPAPQGGGLVGPCPDDGLYWVNLLLPMAIHKEENSP